MALDMHNHRGLGVTVEVDQRLWLTDSQDELVQDGDPRAAFLYCTPGKRVPREEAEKFGLLPSPAASDEPDEDSTKEGDVHDGDEDSEEQEPESKSQKAPPNKSRSRKGST